MTARVNNKPDLLTPYRKFYGRAPFARLIPLLKPNFDHVTRTDKSKPKTQPCFFLRSDNNHAQDFCKVLFLNDFKFCTRDVTWEHPRKPSVRLFRI